MKTHLLILGIALGCCGITFGQIQQKPQLQKTDSLLQALISKPGISFFENPDIVLGNSDSINLPQTVEVIPGFKYTLRILKPDTTYTSPMPVYKPSKKYEYKMRIIDQPVQNSNRDRS